MIQFELRPWRPEDAASIAQYAGNSKIAANLRDVFPHPYALSDAEEYIRDCIANEGGAQICRAIAIEGKAAGSIGVFIKSDVYRKSAEIGYWLAEPYWGQGIMSRAVRRICELAFSQFDIIRIEAEPFAHNTASRRVLEKAGFVLEGTKQKSVYKNGRLHDSCIYARLKECD